ncbi:MAG: Crp/Fnr family transcriptional regulator [Sulfurovum sp.]
MSVKSTIESLDFFGSLDEREIDLLANISTIQSYDNDYILFYEKQQSNKLLFLYTGLAKAYKVDKYNNEVFLYYIYNGTLLSEISTIESDSLLSFANIKLLEKSQILSIDYLQFKKHFLYQNILNIEFINEIISQTKALQNLVNRELIFDAVEKVSIMLYSDLEMFNRLKRGDISLILNIQPATLSRVLNRLKRNNIIDIIQKEVIILDSIALQTIYEEI